MAKFDYKRPGEEKTLEGGGGGGGYSSKNDMRKLAGMAAAEAAGLGYLYKRKKDFEAGVDKLAADRKYEKSKNYGNEGRGKKVPDTTGTSEEGMEKNIPRRQASKLSAPQFGNTETQYNRDAQIEADRRNLGQAGYDEAGELIKPAVQLPTRPGQSTSGKPTYSKDQYGNITENETGKVSRTIFSAGQEGNADRSEMKRGGQVKKMASGGKVSSASSRGDGIAQRGKTKGRMC
jgi:hypothetical protein